MTCLRSLPQRCMILTMMPPVGLEESRERMPRKGGVVMMQDKGGEKTMTREVGAVMTTEILGPQRKEAVNGEPVGLATTGEAAHPSELLPGRCGRGKRGL